MSRNPVVAPTLLTTEQAAEWLTVTPAALRAWRTRGGGPAWIKLGQLVRYDVADLRDWLLLNRIEDHKHNHSNQ